MAKESSELERRWAEFVATQPDNDHIVTKMERWPNLQRRAWGMLLVRSVTDDDVKRIFHMPQWDFEFASVFVFFLLQHLSDDTRRINLLRIVQRRGRGIENEFDGGLREMAAQRILLNSSCTIEELVAIANNVPAIKPLAWQRLLKMCSNGHGNSRDRSHALLGLSCPRHKVAIGNLILAANLASLGELACVIKDSPEDAQRDQAARIAIPRAEKPLLRFIIARCSEPVRIEAARALFAHTPVTLGEKDIRVLARVPALQEKVRKLLETRSNR